MMSYEHIKAVKKTMYIGGLPPFLVPVVMRVSCMYSPCLEEGAA